MIDMSLPPHAGVDTAPAARPARRTAAYALLTASMILLHVTMFVPAALLDCGIRNGRKAAWIAAAIALAIAIVAAPTMLSFMEPRQATSYIVMVACILVLPGLAALPFVQRGESFGRVIVLMTLVAAAGLGAGEMGTRAIGGFSPYAFDVAEAKKAVTDTLAAYKATGVPSDAVDLMRRGLEYASTTLLPGGLVINAATAFILSLLMVGRLSAWRARREASAEDVAYRFRHFAVPEWVLFAFVAGGLVPLTTGLAHAVLANVLAVTVFLFLAQGLALFRFMLAAMGVGFLGAMIASMLVIFSGVGMFLLAIAGLFDPFFDFRHFKKRKDDSHESHSD
jgi:uncharacterized protein YybS (DUF2232 family)